MRRAAVIAVAARDGGVRRRGRRRRAPRTRRAPRPTANAAGRRPPAPRAAPDRLAPVRQRAGLHVLDAARAARPLRAHARRPAPAPSRRPTTPTRPRACSSTSPAGPGRAASPSSRARAARMRALLRDYRLVMLDQRGTGAGALRCPALQRAMGTSDLTVPPPRHRRGVRRGTLGAEPALLLDGRHRRRPRGAARRARAPTSSRSTASPTGPSSPSATRSPTPTAWPGWCSTRSCRRPASTASRSTACARRRAVLRAVCRAQHCPGDPAADLAAVVRRATTAPSSTTRSWR